MGALKGLLVRLRAVARRRATERELDEEIAFHLEQEFRKNVALGMTGDEARRRALVEFGGLAQTREAHRDAYRPRRLEELHADVRYALRTMGRNPALAGAAILTLALGVGANTAIFSAVNAVVLRPLPFAAPERLFMLWEENPEKGWYQQTAAPANVVDWAEQVDAFAGVAAYSDILGGGVTLTWSGRPQSVDVANVTGNFFDVLGVHAALGRTFTEAETWSTGTRIAIVSHRLWRDVLGSDPRVVGRSIDVGGRGVQVVGVMPAGFAFPSEGVDLWTPMAWDPANRGEVWFRRAHWVRPIARLERGVSREAANAQLQAVVARLQRQYPATNQAMGAGMTPLHEFLVGDTRLPLLVLLAAVVILLLIACANVGNLLLVQASGRERETALRLALGAGRERLVRQALADSLVLSVLGGAGGVALGWWGTRALQALQPAGLLPVSRFDLDWSVLAYVAAITTASGLLFGLAPAIWSGHRHPVEILKEGGRSGSEGRRVRRWGERLVIAEVAMALVLTVGAGLLVRSLLRLQRVDPGFDSRGVLAATVSLPAARYDSRDRVLGFVHELEQRLRSVPGVEAAGAASQLPLTFLSWTSDFTVAGWPGGEYGTEVVHRRVTPGYFPVMRVPLLRGRLLTTGDDVGAPPVVLINEALARRYFRGQDPIGRRMTFDRVPDSSSVWRTIVGVVGSEHQTALGTPAMIEVYEPLPQSLATRLSFVVRTPGDPTALGAVRRAVAAADPNLAIMALESMERVRARSLARERFLTTLLLVFAGVGLALAMVGVYGVMAQLARRRMREMGIRVALGARTSQVRWLVVRNGLRVVGVGLVIGTAGALAATRTMHALLFGVTPVDPLTFTIVPAALTLSALVATWLPARQASRADPASTLRLE